MRPFHRILSCLFLALAAVLFFVPPAQADVAPPPPPHGVNIFPGQETTSVRMVSEKVIMEMPANSPYESGHVVVSATFQMRNLGDAAESMQVRFPLCTGWMPGDTIGCFTYPPLEDFGALVDGTPMEITNTYEWLSNPYSNNDNQVNTATWANFPVTFPSGQDVTIQVHYTQLGYAHESANNPEFSYILFTGAGWKDTIGSAEVIFRYPVELNDSTLLNRAPEDGVVSGREIRWQAQDFEPTEKLGTVMVQVMRPDLWQKIQTERKAVTTNPKDGEAWGRLGKAIKAAIIVGKGYIRQGAIGEAMYWESNAAYQKAIELLPNDADWHYGYAHLLWANFYWVRFRVDGVDRRPMLMQVVQQVKAALDLNPNHAGAQNLLKWMANDYQVDLSGPQPVYILLTRTPTLEPTYTPEPSITTRPTRTLTPTATHTPAPTPTLTLLPAQTVTAAEAPKRQPPLCGAVLLPVIVGILLGVRHLRR